MLGIFLSSLFFEILHSAVIVRKRDKKNTFLNFESFFVEKGRKERKIFKMKVNNFEKTFVLRICEEIKTRYFSIKKEFIKHDDGNKHRHKKTIKKYQKTLKSGKKYRNIK